MKTIRSLLVIVTALTLGGCVQANFNEPSVCDAENVSWPVPTIPAVPVDLTKVDCKTVTSYSYVLPQLVTSTSIDESSTLSSINKEVEDFNVVLNSLIVTTPTDLSWTTSVKGELSAPGFTSLTFIGTYTNGSIDFDTSNSGEVYNLLSSGPCTLKLTINAKPIDLCTAEALLATKQIKGTVNFCVGASGQVNKTLSNLTN